jgi:hypothetical protein
MKIIDAKWQKGVNALRIECDCGYYLWHRADRWKVVCPKCKEVDWLGKLRTNYRLENLRAGVENDGE